MPPTNSFITQSGASTSCSSAVLGNVAVNNIDSSSTPGTQVGDRPIANVSTVGVVGRNCMYSDAGISVSTPELGALPSSGGNLGLGNPVFNVGPPSSPLSVPSLGLFGVDRPSLIQSVQDVGPLELHVTQAVKENIWRGQFVDLALLYRENGVVAMTSIDNGSALTMVVED